MPSDLIQIERPSPPGIVAEMAPVVAEARGFLVDGAETYQVAMERARTLRQAERSIQEYFEPSRRAADAAKREILAARDGLIGPVAEARNLYDRKASEYEAEERQRAAAQEAELRERARREEEDRQLEAAMQAQDAGEPDVAEAILEAPVSAPAITVDPAVPKVEGTSSRDKWGAKLDNLETLLWYVMMGKPASPGIRMAHPELLNGLQANMVFWNQLARAQRQNMAIPGVRAVSRPVRSYR